MSPRLDSSAAPSNPHGPSQGAGAGFPTTRAVLGLRGGDVRNQSSPFLIRARAGPLPPPQNFLVDLNRARL